MRFGVLIAETGMNGSTGVERVEACAGLRGVASIHVIADPRDTYTLER